MAVGIANALTTGAINHLEVCPNWDQTGKACTCPKDQDGNPTPAHPTFDFGAKSPDARTNAQWALACAQEARLLVKAQQPAAPTPIAALIGLSA